MRTTMNMAEIAKWRACRAGLLALSGLVLALILGLAPGGLLAGLASAADQAAGTGQSTATQTGGQEVAAPGTPQNGMKAAEDKTLPPPAPPAAGKPSPPPPPPIVHHPASPEEELIYAFVDQILAAFPGPEQNQELSLATNRDYKVEKADGRYRVRLAPFTLTMAEAGSLEMGPVELSCEPKGKDLLSFTLRLPEKMPVQAAGKPGGELRIGSQEISGAWNRATSDFDRLDIKLANLVGENAEKSGRLTVAEILLNGGLAGGDNNTWQESVRGSLKQLELTGKDLRIALAGATIQGDMKGVDAVRYGALKARMQRFGKQGAVPTPEELKQLFADIDLSLQLLSTYTSSMTMTGLAATIEGSSISLDSATYTGDMHRETPGGELVAQSRGEAGKFRFEEAKTAEKPQPVSVVVERAGMSGQGRALAPPAGFFAEIGGSLAGADKVKPEEAEGYMAGQALTVFRKVLELIDSYGSEFTVSGLSVTNAGPQPITLESARFGGGFAVVNGAGGRLHGQIGFTGFRGMAGEGGTIPEAANLSFAVNKIPSLLALLPAPGQMAGTNMEMIQGQLMMQGMNALMTSGMIVSVNDSYLTFPASKLTLALMAQVDQKAKYMSNGTLHLAIEQPDEFARIVNSLSGDPETAKMLASVTALARRGTEGGKTVDRIDARLDEAGKVFINDKDVTALFFPPPPPPAQAAPPAAGAPATKGKAKQPAQGAGK